MRPLSLRDGTMLTKDCPVGCGLQAAFVDVRQFCRRVHCGRLELPDARHVGAPSVNREDVSPTTNLAKRIHDLFFHRQSALWENVIGAEETIFDARSSTLECKYVFIEAVMSTVKIPLEMISIASPCKASWDGMKGDEHARFCGQCSQHVYNISELTQDQAEALIEEHEGKMCVRYFQRFDGTIMTKDCPVGWAAFKRRTLLIGGAAAALVISLFSFFTVGVFAATVAGNGARVRNPIQVIEDILFPRAVAGGICPPAPPVNPPKCNNLTSRPIRQRINNSRRESYKPDAQAKELGRSFAARQLVSFRQRRIINRLILIDPRQRQFHRLDIFLCAPC